MGWWRLTDSFDKTLYDKKVKEVHIEYRATYVTDARRDDSDDTW
jgi:hypothetical protein